MIFEANLEEHFKKLTDNFVNNIPYKKNNEARIVAENYLKSLTISEDGLEINKSDFNKLLKTIEFEDSNIKDRKKKQAQYRKEVKNFAITNKFNTNENKKLLKLLCAFIQNQKMLMEKFNSGLIDFEFLNITYNSYILFFNEYMETTKMDSLSELNLQLNNIYISFFNSIYNAYNALSILNRFDDPLINDTEDTNSLMLFFPEGNFFKYDLYGEFLENWKIHIEKYLKMNLYVYNKKGYKIPYDPFMDFGIRLKNLIESSLSSLTYRRYSTEKIKIDHKEINITTDSEAPSLTKTPPIETKLDYTRLKKLFSILKEYGKIGDFEEILLFHFKPTDSNLYIKQSENTPHEKIQWKGKQTELVFFMNYLSEEKELFTLGKYKQAITAMHFCKKDKTELNSNYLSNAFSDTKDRKIHKNFRDTIDAGLE
jgi:hypothetical protein